MDVVLLRNGIFRRVTHRIPIYLFRAINVWLSLYCLPERDLLKPDTIGVYFCFRKKDLNLGLGAND
jgi:hypothetical protein